MTSLDFPGSHARTTSWGWSVVSGIALMIIGVMAMTYSVMASVLSVLVLGWTLIIAGIVLTVQAFRTRDWSGFLLNVLGAVIAVMTGVVLLRHPAAGMVVLTTALAIYFLVAGIVRTVGAFSLRYPSWGWSAASGVLGIILGVLLLRDWQVASLWFIGFAVGLDLLIEGVGLLTFGFAVRRVGQLVERVVAPTDLRRAG